MMVAVILCSLLQGASSKKQGERFAFVTLHYEGTKGDAEYILGIRVLMASLRGSQYPFIILASDSVSQSSIDLFTAEGATVIPVRHHLFSSPPLTRSSYSLMPASLSLLFPAS